MQALTAKFQVELSDQTHMHSTELADYHTKIQRFQHQIDNHTAEIDTLTQQHEEQVSTLNAEVENYKEQIMQWSDAYTESAQ